MGNGTAEHFRRHLQQFLNDHDLAGSPTGLEDYGPTHSAAWCIVSDDARDLIEGRLRPRRAEIERSGDDGDPEDG